MSDGRSTWHPPGQLLRAYGAGKLDPVRVMSVEAHLGACPGCRADLPADERWLAHSWEQLAVAVARPRVSGTERVLAACRVPEHLARLAVATPALSRAWLAAVAVVLGVAVAFAYATGGVLPDPARLLPFLLAAPVLPVAGVALAYGRPVDPAYELAASTPVATDGRLLLVRTSAALVAALLPAGLAGLVLPGPWLLAAAWLLPALGLTVACLALATRIPVALAAMGLAAGWLAVVLFAGAVTGERLAAFGPAAQVAYATGGALLLVVVHIRRRYLDPGEPRWNPLSGFAR